MKLLEKKIITGCEERGDYDSVYLVRYTLFACSLFQICLHVFHRSDADDMHDHPWNFVSIMLWHGYIEHTLKHYKRYYPGMILFRKATHRHRVVLVNGNKKAVTLVLMSKRKREWGFWVKGVWQQWQNYFVDKGC